MFLIDQRNRNATSLEKKTFSELGLSERKDLQEWICGNPDILGEPLLIIQKEFSGFYDTKERLDLLALDKQGNLVVIENKLDDSGRDVIWQALKYASYCAPLKTNDIRDIFQKYLGESGDASAQICEFLRATEFDDVQLNVGEQRIVLVAAKFRKEVTATVLFLNRHQLDIKCVKVTPYLDRERLYLDAEQILPVQDVGDYQVRLYDKQLTDDAITKTKSKTEKLQKEFWSEAVPRVGEIVDQFRGKPSSRSHAWVGFSYSGVEFNLWILKDAARVELCINTGDTVRNKSIFDALYNQRNKSAALFGNEIEWLRLPDKSASRVTVTYPDFTLTDKETWPATINWLAEKMKTLVDTFKPQIDEATVAWPHTNVPEEAES